MMSVRPSHPEGGTWKPGSTSTSIRENFCGCASDGLVWHSWKRRRWQIPKPTPLKLVSNFQKLTVT
jgi:hypothetical protein